MAKRFLLMTISQIVYGLQDQNSEKNNYVYVNIRRIWNNIYTSHDHHTFLNTNTKKQKQMFEISFNDLL